MKCLYCTEILFNLLRLVAILSISRINISKKTFHCAHKQIAISYIIYHNFKPPTHFAKSFIFPYKNHTDYANPPLNPAFGFTRIFSFINITVPILAKKIRYSSYHQQTLVWQIYNNKRKTK